MNLKDEAEPQGSVSSFICYFLFAIQQRKKLSANYLLRFRRIKEMAAARNDDRFRILHLPDNIHRPRRDNFIVI